MVMLKRLSNRIWDKYHLHILFLLWINKGFDVNKCFFFFLSLQPSHNTQVSFCSFFNNRNICLAKTQSLKSCCCPLDEEISRTRSSIGRNNDSAWPSIDAAAFGSRPVTHPRHKEHTTTPILHWCLCKINKNDLGSPFAIWQLHFVMSS